MTITLLVIATVAALGTAAAVLALYRRIATLARGPTEEQLRVQLDRILQFSDGQSRNLREEVGGTMRGFQDSTLMAFRELGDTLATRMSEFSARMDAGVKAIDDRALTISEKLNHDIAQMGDEAGRAREALRQTIEVKLDDATTKHTTTARESRQESIASFQHLGGVITSTLNQLGLQQNEKLDDVGVALGKMTETQERAQETLRQGVEQRLDAIRTENSAKLEEMRRTVDEKLQSTLEARLGESFTRVVEQLERVHKGIGEMQSLAAGVGDLKKVLSNVRVRGAFGELQLGTLLEQFLSPEQFLKNVQVQENSQERVEFAIRLPGRDADGEVLLPVDAKFPHDDYERLLTAAEAGDAEGVAEASKALENRIRVCAKTIRDKYIVPPRTTDFAILFLPTESLYAEVLRRPGLFETVQREYHVTLTGPTTFIALLNALQMGFRSLAIEKRSSEVWKILGAVRAEFGKYNEVVDRLAKQLNTAAKSVETLGVRTRAMTRQLRDVEVLPEHVSQTLVGIECDDRREENFTDGELRVEQQSTSATTPTEMGRLS